MLEVFRQVVMNLRANKLRSFLTMFGILWGVISVVILSATGEGFQRGLRPFRKEAQSQIPASFDEAEELAHFRVGLRIFRSPGQNLQHPFHSPI